MSAEPQQQPDDNEGDDEIAVRDGVRLTDMPYVMITADEWRRAWVFSYMANPELLSSILIENMSAVEHWLKTGENIAPAAPGTKPKPKVKLV